MDDAEKINRAKVLQQAREECQRAELNRQFPPQSEWSDGMKAAFAEMQNRPPGELS